MTATSWQPKNRRGETGVPNHRALDSATGTTLEVVPGLVEVEMTRSEMRSRSSDREETGEKSTEIRGNPGFGIGIINGLAVNLRQMGGWVEPLWRRRASHPGLSSHFVRFIDPLVGVPVQVQSLIMDMHVHH